LKKLVRVSEIQQETDSAISKIYKGLDFYKKVMGNLNSDNPKDVNASQIFDAFSYKHSVDTTISSIWNKYNNISELIRNSNLNKADKEFEKLISDIFKSANNIRRENPSNAYNGLFASICQRLYVIGEVRRYDMTEFSDILDDMTLVDPLFYSIQKNKRGLEEILQGIDSIRNKCNWYKTNIDKTL
jgi:hypothetical protein